MMKKTAGKTRSSFWLVQGFYGLIAFEFFYMASPFAVYFYSAYSPGLSFLGDIPTLAWLTSLFLPHVVVETSSTIINMHNIAGIFFMLCGLVLFSIAAAQVYRNKLLKQGLVLNGLYKWIRHPQYTSFAICSFGILLLWPRFLVLIMFVSVLFAYYFLARLEERECDEKFASGYSEYRSVTAMFLPFQFKGMADLFKKAQARIGKGSFYFFFYILTILLSLGVARGLQTISINSLYKIESGNSLYISVHKLAPEKMNKMINLVLGDERLGRQLQTASGCINYIVPAEWSISEIPMNIPENNQHSGSGHFLPGDIQNKNLYKIIYSRVDAPTGAGKSLESLLRSAVLLEPLLEVWLDLQKWEITRVLPPPSQSRYNNIPVPLY